MNSLRKLNVVIFRWREVLLKEGLAFD